MKFPEPTVDITEIKRKYHAIVEQQTAGAEETERSAKEPEDDGAQE